jgi:hydrogenase maturation protein HypF
MMNNAINSPLSSGMGRLFDSIAALLGICFRNRYEGEAPMLLESTAERSEKGSYRYEISDGIIDVRRVIRGVVQDILENTPKGIIAGRFMNTVVRFSCDAADRVRMRTGIRETALSGGVFQNRYILEHCEREMHRRGYTVYSNSLIPANDGGLPPGQMGMAAVKRG